MFLPSQDLQGYAKNHLLSCTSPDNSGDFCEEKLEEDEIILFSHTYNLQEFKIEEIADRDDSTTVKTWQNRMIHFQPIVGIFSLAAYMIYLAYRIMVNCRYAKGFGSPNASWAFIAIETTFLSKFLSH